jgi:histidinol-phosphate aminotransferase
MQVRLDCFLKERGELFRWPEDLQPQVRSLANILTNAVTPEVLCTFGIELQEKAEATAQQALKTPDNVSVVFGHSAIQLLEQLLITLCPSIGICTLQQDFFLFDEVFKKLKITSSKFPTIQRLVNETPSDTPVVLSAPNNPTGKDLSDQDLELLLHGRTGLVMIDETYGLFSDNPDRRMSFLARFPQLILVRGSSKYGLPGVGIGYFLSHHKTADQFLETRVSSMIGAVQAAIAVALFENYSDLKSLTSGLIDRKRRIAARISHETDHFPLPGSCDFLLIRSSDGDVDALAQQLRSANLPALSYARLSGYEHIVKLFPATYADGDRLIAALSSSAQV